MAPLKRRVDGVAKRHKALALQEEKICACSSRPLPNSMRRNADTKASFALAPGGSREAGRIPA
ncbi:hypothetical protein BDS110ZK25_04350 [Bradyrhizobium diazoefficiens]|uniref:Uncharacterized protein n=1 Tax=Bradyrhizobium diazoefficiens TaxID=1355477 RepID=A0A809X3Z3_9BRAD|nr:hypothetical protein F07S3_38980 [Bradyrhizobium diazoefficiens]BCA03065.1 hypothetical protein H12S4_39690 [Bradyrhizobium diazoefficiens]BCA11816.1 hypothetical protein BDHF08_36630 [Bradyrhizobium diazoefficiens]BCA20428.1 hypothetical protein BDHH15_36430 [Bradyrhizobium diazoefficiens]BCE21038.1 hypothetical protein XF1B_37190 [Bradyrhizobium diazoefficiens]